MNQSTVRFTAFGSIQIFARWVFLCLFAMVGQASAALSLSPTTVALSAGTYSTVKISGASGEVQAESKNTAVATVSLSNVSQSGATLNVFGKGAGNTQILIRDGTSQIVSVSVTVVAATTMTVAPTTLSVVAGANGILTASRVSGTLSASSSNATVASVSVSGNVVTVKGSAAGSALVAVKDGKTTVTVPVTVTASGGGWQWREILASCLE